MSSFHAVQRGRPAKSTNTRKEQLIAAQRRYRRKQQRLGRQCLQLFLSRNLVSAIDERVALSAKAGSTQTRSEILETALKKVFVKEVKQKGKK